MENTTPGVHTRGCICGYSGTKDHNCEWEVENLRAKLAAAENDANQWKMLFEGRGNDIAAAQKDTARHCKSWAEFRSAGLLWWVNRILHVFGWAIKVDIADDGRVIRGYPDRVEFTCFSEECEEDGVSKLRSYMLENAQHLRAAIDDAKGE